MLTLDKLVFPWTIMWHSLRSDRSVSMLDSVVDSILRPAESLNLTYVCTAARVNSRKANYLWKINHRLTNDVGGLPVTTMQVVLYRNIPWGPPSKHSILLNISYRKYIRRAAVDVLKRSSPQWNLLMQEGQISTTILWFRVHLLRSPRYLNLKLARQNRCLTQWIYRT